ncbi:HNH endonuclease [Cedecea davisae]|uniref:HNH endonuclease n=1 Tax=Cedecea davisae TaxID=158484 RepID=UPI00376ED2DC
MTSKINSHYVLTAQDAFLIKTHFVSHKDWNKAVFSSFKESLIEHLRKEQGNKCCYCKRTLGFDLKEVEIEHIIPKSEYEIFTFHTKNLALSCPGCNVSKNAEDVLKVKIKRYPTTGKNFKIVHAYFDDYYDHIEIHSNSIYEGLDEKGLNTLSACKIYRLKDVLRRQRENDRQQGSVLALLIQALTHATPEQQQDLNQAIESIIMSK